jgi:hypothetical protein
LLIGDRSKKEALRMLPQKSEPQKAHSAERSLEDMHVSREVDRKGVEIRKFQMLAMSNTLNIQRD